MVKKIIFLFCILCCEIVFSQGRFRGGGGGSKITKLGLTFSNFTGSERTSFAKGAPAYGIEVSTDGGGRHLRYFLKGRVIYSTGQQDFIKNSIIYNSKYEFASISPEIGLSLYPVAKRDTGLNLYLYGVGVASYNYLYLMNIPTTVTGVDAKTQDFGLGYGGGIGVEYGFGSTGGGTRANRDTASGRNMIFAEAGFRDMTAPIGGQSKFDLSQIVVTLGYGF